MIEAKVADLPAHALCQALPISCRDAPNRHQLGEVLTLLPSSFPEDCEIVPHALNLHLLGTDLAQLHDDILCHLVLQARADSGRGARLLYSYQAKA